jgi:hypothetical protein
MAQDPAAVMLANLQAQRTNRKNFTKDEKRMAAQVRAANRQASDMLRQELIAAGIQRPEMQDILRSQNQAFRQAEQEYKTLARGTEGTQRFAGFGEGSYYAPAFQYAGPEAQAVAQRIQQGQQFLQQYQVPQFFRQGRTGVGFKAPQAYALSQAMADGQVSAEELTSQYGQYFKPKQAERVAGYVNTIQRYTTDPSITAEDFTRKLKPVKGMEGLYQTRLEGGQYNNLTGVFRDLGNGQYQMVGVAPTKTKKEDSGGFFGKVLRIGGALIAPFNPAVGALASGIGTLASGGNLGQAILGGATSFAGSGLGTIGGLAGSIPSGLSSVVGGGIAAATPVNQNANIPPVQIV